MSVGVVRPARWVLERTLLGVVLAVATAMLGAASAWRPVHDQVLMEYVAFAHDAFGKLPYRDIFEMNPPGTHLLHLLLFALVGRNELGLRIVDLTWLLATGIAVLVYLRPAGLRVGLTAACLFTIDYLSLGPLHSMQREYLCVLPAALALCLAFRARGPIARRTFWIGVLYGVVLTIKPLLAVGVIPVLLAVLHARWRELGPSPARSRVVTALGQTLAAGAIGGLLPALGCVLYLASTDSLLPFLRIVRDYWPLYAQLGGDGSVRAGLLATSTLDGVRSVIGTGTMLALFPVGSYAIATRLREPELRPEVLTLFATVAAFVAYIALNGKFWE